MPACRDGGARALHYDGTPHLMSEYAAYAVDAGVSIVGGCCGNRPEHIAAMRRALDGHVARARPDEATIGVRRWDRPSRRPATTTVSDASGGVARCAKDAVLGPLSAFQNSSTIPETSG